MNRLWIRLSLAFTAVFIVAVLAIILAFRLTGTIGTDPENPPPAPAVLYVEEKPEKGAKTSSSPGLGPRPFDATEHGLVECDVKQRA